MRGLGYIQSSPALFILPHIYSCPPPGKWINFKNKPKPNLLKGQKGKISD
jgi:hypothetical protein